MNSCIFRSPAAGSNVTNSPLDEMLRKSNMMAFGEVTVSNHPNTPPIPMTLPMVYLVPISKDDTTGEAKYKMLVPRSGPEIPPVNFPPFFPLHSPPLIPSLNQRFQTGTGSSEEPLNVEIIKKPQKPEARVSNGKSSSLKVETSEAETPSAPLDLTHRSPNSIASDNDEDGIKSKKDFIKTLSSSPENKLGTDIEEHLQFLKVKHMELLKQAAESAQNRCNECNITFSKYQNYVAHKKYYCSGLKNSQSQDSDEESPAPAPSSSSAPGKKQTPLASPSSPPFSPSSQNMQLHKQNLFNQEFFLNQKSLMENFPGKIPLLMTPPVMNMQQPNTSHFVCQGCGIKFKSISNLKAHQSRYCSGIKQNEEPSNPPGNPSLETLLKSQMAAGAAAAGHPLQGLSAADMITFLSAQHMASVKNMEEKKASSSPPAPSAPSPTTPSRGKSPKAIPDSAGSPLGNKPENNESDKDFCLVLCGFKESAVDLNKLKEQFNMQFIGQVKKRKSDGENDDTEVDDPSHVNETTEEPINKKVKKEDVSPDDFPVKINTLLDNGESQLEAKQESMKCANCNISFVNAATFKAHVNFYCKKRDPSQE